MITRTKYTDLNSARRLAESLLTMSANAALCAAEAQNCMDMYSDGAVFPGVSTNPDLPQNYLQSACMWLAKGASYEWGYALPAWWPLEKG